MKKQMPSIRLIALLLITVIIAGSSCTRKTKKEGNLPPFEADTLRGTALDFTKVESGYVTLKPGAIDLLGDVDENGSPKMGTSDAVASFDAKNELPAADGTGMAIRFLVPTIADNDYCIIRAEITLPGKVFIGGQQADVITADFRYDARNSGRTEYIWFLFSKNAQELMLKGNWAITLSNNGIKILTTEFIVK